MWYRFEEGNPVGIPRIRGYRVAFYDMTQNGGCFDETYYSPDKINKAISYVETIEDKDDYDRTRVFADFDNGDVYELKLEKVNKKYLSNFYD